MTATCMMNLLRPVSRARQAEERPGSRDEEKAAMGSDPEPTRVTKKDKVQPDTGTRSDNEGANR